MVFLSGRRQVRFHALQGALVPRARAFDAAQRAESERLVNELIATMPPANQRKLGVFLLLIDLVSIFTGLRPFRRLSDAGQLRVLGWLFDNPVGLLRKGFWGLNSVAKLGVYGQTDCYPEIGYRIRENPDE